MGGFTFIGWSTDIPATMPADDIAVTALWKPDDSYHLTPSYGQPAPTTKAELNGETPASGTSSTPDNAYYTSDNDVYYESPSTTTAKGMLPNSRNSGRL